MAGSGIAHLRDDGAILSVANLIVDYPTRAGTVQAVSDVSFDLMPGETLGLVGESGCGKSTAARAVIGLVRPNAGTVQFSGCDLTHLNQRSLRRLRPRLQIIFQDPRSSLNPRRRVGKVVGEGLRIWKRGSKADREEQIRAMLAQVGLDYELAAGKKAASFSGGQCQRISIARALLMKPQVLICDEPVSSLDVSVQAQIINLLAEMKQRFGLSMLFISHDLAVIENVSDRVMVMYLGKICEVGPSDALYSDPAHPYTVGLLAAVPSPDPEQRRTGERGHLQGEVPSSMAPPSGCRFHTRCPRAQPVCSDIEPEIRAVADDHFVACHFPVGGAVGNGGPRSPSLAAMAIMAEETRATLDPPVTSSNTDSTTAPAANIPEPPSRRGLPKHFANLASRVRGVSFRLFRFVATVVAVTFTTTLLLRLVPGSPARYILGGAATPATIRAFNRRFQFNGSVFQEYAHWMGNLLHGNLGISAFTQQPIRVALLQSLPVSAELVFLATVLAALISIPLGLLCARRPESRFDRIVTGATSGFLSVPVFVLAILLVYLFAVRVHVFPVLGWTPLTQSLVGNLRCVALPVTAISIPEIVVMTRILRAELIGTLQQDYISLARSKGLSTRRILLRHALKPASFSLITVSGLSLARLLGGTVIVENIFVLPGLGTLIVNSIQNRDIQTAQVVVTFIALAVLVVNLAVDLSYQFLDPRSRLRR
jgi:peptide/nickel transport system ATP-binding protein